eukprot:scaffold3742_cov74-Phaeocystis_antarctica.AAC.1
MRTMRRSRPHTTTPLPTSRSTTTSFPRSLPLHPWLAGPLTKRVLLCNPAEMAASVPSAPRKVCALARPGGPAVLVCGGAMIG